MPDFSHYSNYWGGNVEHSQENRDSPYPFSRVVFGAGAPVLEVELNELQELMDTKFKRLAQLVGDRVYPKSGMHFNPSTKELTLTNCYAVSGFLTAQIGSASVTLSEGAPLVFLDLCLVDVSNTSTLHIDGNTASGYDLDLNAAMIDGRVGVETTRRKAVTHTLYTAPSYAPKTQTNEFRHLFLGRMVKNSDGSFSFNYSDTCGDSIVDTLKDSTKIDEHNSSVYAHPDLRAALSNATSVENITITIPTTGWTSSGKSKYVYTVSVSNSKVLETHIPYVSFDVDNLARVSSCGLCSSVQTVNGALRFWAMSVPTSSITATVSLMRSGGVTANTLAVATTSTPGAVKPGDGLSVAPDGTLSVDRDRVLTNIDLANEDEVANSVADILNG